VPYAFDENPHPASTRPLGTAFAVAAPSAVMARQATATLATAFFVGVDANPTGFPS
jgi:hypothetical protein